MAPMAICISRRMCQLMASGDDACSYVLCHGGVTALVRRPCVEGESFEEGS